MANRPHPRRETPYLSAYSISQDKVTQRRAFFQRSLQLGLIAPTAVATIAGCQPTDQRALGVAHNDRHHTISFVGAVMNNPFWDQIQKGATSAGKDLDGVDLTYLAPEEFSHANINEIIRSALSAEPDGIAIDYRGRMFEEITKEALDSGIAVQFYNNFAGQESADHRVVQLARTAVGLDKYQAALRSAKHFLPHILPGEPLVLFNGIPDSPEHLEVQNAYLQVLADAGWTDSQVKVFPVTLDPAENYELMATYFAAHPETAGVICWDSVTGSAAARATRDAKMEIPVMAWNLDATIIRAIKSGTLNQTLTQQPFLQGYYAVVGMYMKLQYGFIDPPVVDPATLIVNHSNIEQVEQLYKAGIAG